MMESGIRERSSFLYDSYTFNYDKNIYLAEMKDRLTEYSFTDEFKNNLRLSFDESVLKKERNDDLYTSSLTKYQDIDFRTIQDLKPPIDAIETQRDADSFYENMCHDPFIDDNYRYLKKNFDRTSFLKNNENEALIPSTSDHLVLVSISSFKYPKDVRQEFLFESTMTLNDLKTKISCVFSRQDLVQTCTCTETDEKVSPNEIIQESFFFIENKFYSSHFHDDSCNISKSINASCRKFSSKFFLGSTIIKGGFDTKISDLFVVPGKTYLYCHCLKCEHRIIFKDFKYHKGGIASYIKSLRSWKYIPNNTPTELFRHVKRRFFCGICLVQLATWATRNDVSSYDDPSYFCDRCFHFLHHNIDGSHPASFHAYQINYF